MLYRLNVLLSEFPRQLWILFGGTLVNSTGMGMVFPFLTLYLHQRLNISLTSVGVILTLWSVSGLVGQLMGGSFSDKLGRKKLMVTSLLLNAIGLVGFAFAETLPIAIFMTVFVGFVGALYQPARDAMIADLVGSEKRSRAYSLMRVIHNLGIAIGPAIGGFLAARAFQLAFFTSASTTFFFFLVTVFLIQETHHTTTTSSVLQSSGSFSQVLRDSRFIAFCVCTMLVVFAASQMMTVLPVYMKDQYGLSEEYYGWVMSANAGMVVLFQFAITSATEKYNRLLMSAIGALFYAVGVSSVAFGSAFIHFILAMVVITIGEMIVFPNANAIAADSAPVSMRGRYMGVLGLSWSMGYGVGPVLGGLVNDHIAPIATWLILGSSAFVGAIGYWLIHHLTKPN